MNDLVDPLRAALDVAEQQAKTAHDDEIAWIADDVAANGLPACGAHIEAWCPATVLRLIARDRQLIADYEEAWAWYSTHLVESAGELHGLGTALKAAAAFWLPKEDGSTDGRA